MRRCWRKGLGIVWSVRPCSVVRGSLKNWLRAVGLAGRVAGRPARTAFRRLGGAERCGADETDADSLGLFWADPYSFTPPQGEPVAAFAARVLAAVARLQAAYAGGRVLLVSHGGVMRLLLAQARGLPPGAITQR